MHEAKLVAAVLISRLCKLVARRVEVRRVANHAAVTAEGYLLPDSLQDMDAPSWVELMGRHAASATLFLSGSLHYLDEGPDGVAVDGRFGFWHAPGGQWRIEDEDGHLVYLRGADGTAFVRGSDGELEQLNARIVVPTLASFSPLEAIAPHSVVNNLSEGMRPLGPVARGEVGNRSAWTIPLGSETPVIVVSFDHATGVLVRLMNAEGLVPFQVTKLLQHDSLPLDRFQLL